MLIIKPASEANGQLSAAELMAAARDHLAKQNPEAAVTALLDLLQKDEAHIEANDLVAEIRLAQGNKSEGIYYLMRAIVAEPLNLPRLQHFLDVAGRISVEQFDPVLDHILLLCLKHADVLDCTRMQPLWASNLRYEPAFHAAYNLRSDTPNDAYDNLTNFRPLLEPRFLLGVKNLVVCMPVFEKFITRMRRHVLEDYLADTKKLAERDLVTLAEAFAHYALHTDYILDTPSEEQEQVDILRKAVESGAKADAASIAVLACYVPLYTLGNAADIEIAHAVTPAIAELVSTQITAHTILHETALGITAITPISKGVSEEVRKQYEEFPYPRWRTLSADRIRREWASTRQSVKIEGHLKDREIDILNAGCGTGHEALHLATLYPRARILAVDLSRNSMAYAMAKAQEYDITNITFHQADILQLGKLDRKFDFISSAGVVHHLGDHVAGWHVLSGLLKPGGVLSIALYSKIARKYIIEARRIAAEKGYTGTADSMRAFRKDSPMLLDKQLLDRLKGYVDYYTLNMFRDLLFHVQEHNYDIPELAETIKGAGLTFAGFCVTNDVMAAFARDFPSDPEGLDLANWHLFEQRNPNLFANMYDFWCRKA